MAVLGTERWPSYQTLEHDRSQRPPIAIERITLTSEDFGGDVIRCTDSGVGHQSTRSSPVVDLSSVRDSEIDLIDGDGSPISGTIRFALQKLLVVVIVMKLMETSRKTEIRQLDVTTSIQKNIVWLDITKLTLACCRSFLTSIVVHTDG